MALEVGALGGPWEGEDDNRKAEKGTHDSIQTLVESRRLYPPAVNFGEFSRYGLCSPAYSIQSSLKEYVQYMRSDPVAASNIREGMLLWPSYL